jgi:hypothetical protein
MLAADREAIDAARRDVSAREDACRVDEATLAEARTRFEVECAERIRQLDARDRRSARAEDIARRLDDREASLQVQRSHTQATQCLGYSVRGSRSQATLCFRSSLSEQNFCAVTCFGYVFRWCECNECCSVCILAFWLSSILSLSLIPLDIFAVASLLHARHSADTC